MFVTGLTGVLLAASPRRMAGLAMITAALLTSAPAAAEHTAERSDAEVAQRLAFIETRLERAEPSAALWWSAWYYGYVGITVGQAGFALAVKDPKLRIDTAVGAAFSSVGVLGVGVFDFAPRHAGTDLRAFPASTPDERRRKLAKAERLLAACSQAEIAGRSWIPHVAGVALSLTDGLVLAFAYRRVVSGLVALVSGVAITEAQVFTRPTAAIDDWRAYQAGAFAGSTPVTSTSLPVRFVPHTGGMGVAVAF
jgi:hypothetical protein